MHKSYLKLQISCALIQVLRSFTLVQSSRIQHQKRDQSVVKHFWSNLARRVSCDSHLHRTAEKTQTYWQTIESEVGLPSRSFSNSKYIFAHQLSINWLVQLLMIWRTQLTFFASCHHWLISVVPTYCYCHSLLYIYRRCVRPTPLSVLTYWYNIMLSNFKLLSLQSVILVACIVIKRIIVNYNQGVRSHSNSLL